MIDRLFPGLCERNRKLVAMTKTLNIWKQQLSRFGEVPHFNSFIVTSGHDLQVVELKARDSVCVLPQRHESLPALQGPDLQTVQFNWFNM